MDKRIIAITHDEIAHTFVNMDSFISYCLAMGEDRLNFESVQEVDSPLPLDLILADAFADQAQEIAQEQRSH